MKLAAETMGQGADLVLLHGWGMNSMVWEPLLPRLRERFRVTRVDLPGHGDSPWDSRLVTLEQWAQALLETVPPRAHWMGWSLGGLVMQQAASLAPERAEALVGIATTPSFVRRQGWEAAMEPQLLEQFAVQLEQDHAGTLKRFLALQFQGVKQGRALQRQVSTLLASRPAPRPGALRAGLRLLQESDLRNALSGLEPPLLWILGERDRLVPPALAGLLPERAPHLQVRRVPGGGHAPFLSHPEEVAGLVTDFQAHA
ncbi:MAG: pimeloyl-[acyl-carrier protein] methyl ester esterase [Gammaproteobacteria bacterium]|nr:MAG: pimeloyl-[acyl-carrier protein] methyl ester esterase [Gammaproteobacteria bacterium]RTZ75359.1 MAG: pimeloyl-[acyl-carrier protein] methyl ester esterase [Gammaproteobacteria bacterium]